MIFFPALIFYLFLLKCSDANLFSLWLIIFWNIKMMYWKRQTPEAVYLLKLSNKNTTGIIESCSKLKYNAVFSPVLII